MSATESYPDNTIFYSDIGSPRLSLEKIPIEIYEGEWIYCGNKTKIGVFNVRGIPKRTRNGSPVQIGVEVDQNGILNVWAKIEATQQAQAITLDTTKFCLDKPILSQLANEFKQFNLQWFLFVNYIMHVACFFVFLFFI